MGAREMMPHDLEYRGEREVQSHNLANLGKLREECTSEDAPRNDNGEFGQLEGVSPGSRGMVSSRVSWRTPRPRELREGRRVVKAFQASRPEA